MNGDWLKTTIYESKYGQVSAMEGDLDGDWVAHVRLPNGQFGRLSERYACAPTAMQAVERTWKRERDIVTGRKCVIALGLG